jgi:hypothetical protein
VSSQVLVAWGQIGLAFNLATRIVLQVLQMAAHGGLQRLAGQAARMLAAERYVTRDMLDDAQRELDTTEALWRAVGWVV